jgi:Fe-S cluster biogenesis protein NfuA
MAARPKDASAAHPDDVPRRMDEAAVAHRVSEVSRLLGAHAGGIELEQLDEEGRVRIRFTGMCTGCLFRPVTMATTIRPALLEVDGVRGVEATGVRISEHAARRLAEASIPWWVDLKGRANSGSTPGA